MKKNIYEKNNDTKINLLNFIKEIIDQTIDS